MGQDIRRVKTIVCHLGNGSSICAVKYGKVVDNSMGFTPLGGSGDGYQVAGMWIRERWNSWQQKENLDYSSDYDGSESGIRSPWVIYLKICPVYFRELKDAGIKYNRKSVLAREYFCL